MGGAGKEAERRRRVLDHAKQTGNVAKTFRYFGIGRASFYRWRQEYLNQEANRLGGFAMGLGRVKTLSLRWRRPRAFGGFDANRRHWYLRATVGHLGRAAGQESDAAGPAMPGSPR